MRLQRGNKHSLKAVLLTAALTITMTATNVFGIGLELIPTLDGDTTSYPSAITPDGKYVVGQSGGTRGFLYPVGSGIVYNVLSSDNAQATIANGVGYRTYGGNQELIISGLSSGYVTEWMTMDGGATFGVKRRNVSYNANTVNSYNMLGSPGDTDEYFVTSRTSNQLRLDINRGNGAWPATILSSPKSVTSQARMQGIGATGAAVGSRVSGVRSNYRMDFNPAGSPYNAYFPGLNTVTVNQGEAWDVSDDGLYVTGWSGLGTDEANSYAYKATFLGTVWQSTSQLPVTGLEDGSTAKTVAYGISPDGRWIVGGSYQTTSYHALLWDTGDANPANWTYTDLTQYAIDRGLLDGFSILRRGFSVGLDLLTGDPIVAGEGLYGGVQRAWVMQIPEPSAAALAGLGVCALLVFRRRK